MNIVLYKSSIVMFLIHIIKCIYSYLEGNIEYICFFVFFFGCITSIINHGFTSIYLKLLDRITMIMFCIFDFLFLEHYKLLLIISIIFFFYSKYTNNVIYHLLSHSILTLFHILQF